MGQIFTLDADTLAVITAALDDLIEEFGKDCMLVYPPRWVECANCVPGLGGQPSNRWKTGGPLPFPAGSVCPLCGGQGRRAEEETELVHVSCEWNPREFQFLFPNVNVRAPFSTLKTKSFLSLAPKLSRCDHLRMQVPVDGITLRKFQLASQPGDVSSIVQDRYCVAYWKQVL